MRALSVLVLLLAVAAIADAKKPIHHRRAENAHVPLRHRGPSASERAAWGNFTNPVLWNDLADLDVFRVNETYYYSASTMHYSPGAPILRSYDLVNWEYVAHSVPVLDWTPDFNLTDGRSAYVKGIWASFLNYRPSNGLFYWGGCIQGATGSYIYSAPAVTGPWTKHGPVSTCFYDAGMLVDDDDTMYVAYGSQNINVAQLSADGYSVVKSQQVVASSVYIEGSRFYKRNGFYYLWNTQPANAQWVSRASNVWGPYTSKRVLNNMPPPVTGAGIPHQGGLVNTPNGDWYYMAFIDNYPGGRTPVLAPISWEDDWPVIQTVGDGWGASYPYPVQPHPLPAPGIGTDSFDSTELSAQWEWNHNPDNSKWSTGAGLKLYTATVTTDIYAARNTLTHRIVGPQSNGTIVLNFDTMLPGDRAGLSMFRDQSAWIGIMKEADSTLLAFVTDISMTSNWKTQSNGTVAATVELDAEQTSVMLSITVDIHPGTGREAHFFYSLDDGVTYEQLGSYTLTNAWEFFMGYRYGIFNYATHALGGHVLVDSFTMELTTAESDE